MLSVSFLVLRRALLSCATRRGPLLPNRRSKLCSVSFLLAGLPDRFCLAPGIIGTAVLVARIGRSAVGTCWGNPPSTGGAHNVHHAASLAKFSTANCTSWPAPTRSCQIFSDHLASYRYRTEFVCERLLLIGKNRPVCKYEERTPLSMGTVDESPTQPFLPSGRTLHGLSLPGAVATHSTMSTMGRTGLSAEKTQALLAGEFSCDREYRVKGIGMGIFYQILDRSRGTCWLLLVVVAGGCTKDPAPSTESAPTPIVEATLDQETWDVVFLSGERVGHIHTRVFRESVPDGDRLRIEQNEVLTLRSNNNRIETSTSIQSLETPDGKLLEFTSILPQGELPLKTTGLVVGNELRIEVATASHKPRATPDSDDSRQFEVTTTGQKTTTTLPWAAEFGGPYRVASSLRAKPLSPGETRTLRYLDAATNQLATTVLTASDYEATDLTEGSSSLLRVEAKTMIGGHAINGILWTDKEGDILKTQVPEMFDYVAMRATREEALRKVSDIDFDLGKKSAVRVERSLPSPHQTKKIVYQVRLESSDPTQVFDSGLTQQVTPEDDEHTARITVYAIRPGNLAGNPKAQPEGTTDGDLKPNNLIQSDDPTVVFLAQQAAGDIDDPWQAALALEKLVHSKMTSLGISSAFATAGEVARDLKGDCTEHAVLLAALARAKGIPARVAIGLIYYRQEFLYHMWTEVHVAGAWIPLDATLGLGGIGAAHLKITDSNLEGASPNAAFLPVTEVIGQLKIEILDVE